MLPLQKKTTKDVADITFKLKGHFFNEKREQKVHFTMFKPLLIVLPENDFYSFLKKGQGPKGRSSFCLG